ncbi:MAG: peptidase E [Flavobacteriaceae bacterium]|nr:peptidase E [Flavobacteriaceae bacterium]
MMKSLRILLVLVIPLFLSVGLHKFYVSVTQIEYVAEQEAVQIISRIFIDDFERMLQERYDDSIVLGMEDESPIADLYTERYIKEKLTIQIDAEPMELTFIGKEYEDDIMFVYLEILGVNNISSMEIGNEVLFDLFDDQQNIIRTSVKGKKKSIILIKENAKGVLNFK